MVCAKCAKATKPTSLATPAVKKKSEMYYGSPAGTKSNAGSSGSSKVTLGNTGIGKSKLLSQSAKNPYAAYSKVCAAPECATKIEANHKLCHKCAYRKNACTICGKANAKTTSGAPVIAGQKFTLK